MQPGHSCNFWENYEADLRRNVDMGCTSMRFSLEWHRIEPQRGQINADAIAHFHKILDVMDKCVLSVADLSSAFMGCRAMLPRLLIGKYCRLLTREQSPGHMLFLCKSTVANNLLSRQAGHHAAGDAAPLRAPPVVRGHRRLREGGEHTAVPDLGGARIQVRTDAVLQARRCSSCSCVAGRMGHGVISMAGSDIVSAWTADTLAAVRSLGSPARDPMHPMRSQAMSLQPNVCQSSRREFGPRIRSWSTFNEPGVFAFSGYVFASFPPGKFLATQLAGLVVKHMLIGHDKAYHLIKSLPGAACTLIITPVMFTGPPYVPRRIAHPPASWGHTLT